MKKSTTVKEARPGRVHVPEDDVNVQRILAPTDFSPVSIAALPQALSFARRFSAELVLLHVIETFPIDYLVGLDDSGKINAALEEQARARIDDLARKIGYPGIETVIRWGKPFQEIVNAADELRADLIVLATHGHTGLKHAYLGSTAERVVRHARCPVLVVRSEALQKKLPLPNKR